MRKYFMQDTPLAWVEKFMMQPPNYHRRTGNSDGGSAYACTRCVRREDRKLLCAGAPECICFDERLKYGFWSFHDLLDHYINTTATERAKNRIRKIFAKQKNIFIDEAHHKRMDELAAAGITGNYPYIAAAFLISADDALYGRTRPAFGRQAVYFHKAGQTSRPTPTYFQASGSVSSAFRTRNRRRTALTPTTTNTASTPRLSHR